ncbi:MAG: SRPBCC domain-containing protein [Cyclobacteriaceae bacterium]|jgi:uncharacterized protein YndB with AHSA1/START domain|nr:SRPBCC domain-containing protein [Flammeovirgaceae bacterium]
MAFRIILYFFLTLIFLVASVITIAIGGSGFIAFVWLIFCGLSIYGIYTTLTAYQRIKLSGTQLLVTKIIGANQTLYLEELHEWQEKRYYLRSSLRRSLILFFAHNQRFLFSNKNQPEEFEKLAHFLLTNSITALRDHSPDKELQSTRDMPFDPEKIFSACTTSTSFQAWWVSPEESSYVLAFNPTPGGILHITMHGFGSVKVMQGHFKEVRAPEFISWTQADAVPVEWQVRVTRKAPGLSTVTLNAVYPSLPKADAVRTHVMKEVEQRIQQLEQWLGKPI